MLLEKSMLARKSADMCLPMASSMCYEELRTCRDPHTPEVDRHRLNSKVERSQEKSSGGLADSIPETKNPMLWTSQRSRSQLVHSRSTARTSGRTTARRMRSCRLLYGGELSFISMTAG